MDLLDFARGPGLIIALTVFVLGTLWRLVGVLLLPRVHDHSPAREGAASNFVAALRTNLRAMWPRQEYARSTLFVTINGYAFHIGLALVFFAYAPHIAFIRRLTGLSWLALLDSVIYIAAAATIVALLFALAMRPTDPVRKKISASCWDASISGACDALPRQYRESRGISIHFDGASDSRNSTSSRLTTSGCSCCTQ